MKKIIHFTKLRYIMFAVSFLFIAGGLGYTFLFQGGFNIGVDFQAGMNQRVQIANSAMEILYSGKGTASIGVTGTSIKLSQEGISETVVYTEFFFKTYPNLKAISEALQKINGITVTLKAPENTPSESLVGTGYDLKLSAAEPQHLNVELDPSQPIFADIDQVRNATKALGSTEIQIVGKPHDQDFIIRVRDNGSDSQFSKTMPSRIANTLGAVFGNEKIVMQQTEYIGPKFSETLAGQAIWLTALTLVLILIYATIRFKFAFGSAAVLAIIHDCCTMLAFMGITRMEFNVTQIAAILTIAGYSINDTIVNYDRIRENLKLMHDSDFETIVNASITKTMGRTIITTGVTVLSVLAIFLFTQGTMKDFAAALMFGMISGIYSTIFIACSTVVEIRRAQHKKKKIEKTAVEEITGSTAPAVPEKKTAFQETVKISKKRRALKNS